VGITGYSILILRGKGVTVGIQGGTLESFQHRTSRGKRILDSKNSHYSRSRGVCRLQRLSERRGNPVVGKGGIGIYSKNQQTPKRKKRVKEQKVSRKEKEVVLLFSP